MEIKTLEYKLDYGLLDFFMDLIPPGTALFLCVKILGFALEQVNEVYGSLKRLGCSVLIAAGIVFGLVFLYEIFESIVTGSNRKVRIQRVMDCFLISFGCRIHFFRRSDVLAFDFDENRKRLMIRVIRCLEKRRGIYSYSRLFQETDNPFIPAGTAGYLSPLVEGGICQMKFGSACQKPYNLLNPFSWTSVSGFQLIEKDRIFEISIPCPSGEIASVIVAEIISSGKIKVVCADL